MEDLQSLLEKINREGVEKADAEAAKIVSAAKAEATKIVSVAKVEAEKARAQAQQDAADYASRAAETVRQASRDVVLGIEASVTKMLENLLLRSVDQVLANPDAVAALAAQAVGEMAGPGEVTCGPKLCAALATALSGKPFTVVTDETLEAGFTVRLENGRVEHAFTPDVIAGELAKRLRPDLAKLMK